MTNHVHLLLTPTKEDSTSKMMQSIGRNYVQYFNFNYQRTGTLFEGRYKATLIGSEHYLFTCMRYIELNPVRAKMVAHPSEYQWSSYRHNGLGEFDALIQPHLEYERLGETCEEQQKKYQELFNISCDISTLKDIREVTNKGWVLGTDEYKKILAQQLSRRVTPGVKGGDRKLKSYYGRVKSIEPDPIDRINRT